MNKWPEGAGTYPLGASPQKVRQSVSGTELMVIDGGRPRFALLAR